MRLQHRTRTGRLSDLGLFVRRGAPRSYEDLPVSYRSLAMQSANYNGALPLPAPAPRPALAQTCATRKTYGDDSRYVIIVFPQLQGMAPRRHRRPRHTNCLGAC